MGRGPERTHPRRRSTPGPTDRAGTSASSRCCELPDLGRRAAWPVTGCSRWSGRRAGQMQLSLVRPAGRRAGAPRRASCSIRPRWSADAADGHRLVPPVARRRARRLRHLRGRRRALASCGSSTSRPASTWPTRSPRPGPPASAWLPDGSGVPLHPLPGGRRVPPAWSTATASAADWDDDELVWGELPTPESWPDVAVSPDGRCALVHVARRLGPHRRAPPRRAVRRRGGRSSRASRRSPTLRFDGDRLVGVTTLDAPRGPGRRRPPRPAPCRRGVDDPRARGRRACSTAAGRSAAACCVVATRRGRRPPHTATRPTAPRSARWPCPSSARCAGFDAGADRSLAFVPARVVHPAGAPVPLDARRRARGRGRVADARRRLLDRPPFAVRQERYPSPTAPRSGCSSIHRADVHARRRHARILTGYGGFAIADVAGVVAGHRGVVRARRPVRRRRAPGRLRGGRGVAPGRAAASTSSASSTTSHAAADHLVASRRTTSRDRLALRGGSNGGLLVGAAHDAAARPGRAVHCAVPLLDMVRYPQFLIARLWTDEYGDPDVAEEFAWLLGVLAVPPRRRTASATRPCSSRRPRATAGSTRSTPARWRPRCRPPASCRRRPPDPAAPGGPGRPRRGQAAAASRPTSWPTSSSFFSWQLGVP